MESRVRLRCFAAGPALGRMLISHLGRRPRIARDAYVAPSATLCGDVQVGKGARIMHGAMLIAEGGEITIGQNSIIFENAVIRATARHDCWVGSNCVICPNTHLAGCRVGDRVFIATGAAAFHSSRLEDDCEVRAHAIVHIKTTVASGKVIPVGWVAIGNPARAFPPEKHTEIWRIQKALNFPLTVYGVPRCKGSMVAITAYLGKVLGRHRADKVVSR
jgi:carbonic anhydrase/acetyltransferase-like protein (isoleucine patch superfamily)